MALHKKIWITCDGYDTVHDDMCDAVVSLEGEEITHAWVMSRARDQGWVRRGGVWLCPDHQGAPS